MPKPMHKHNESAKTWQRAGFEVGCTTCIVRNPSENHAANLLFFENFPMKNAVKIQRSDYTIQCSLKFLSFRSD